MILASSLNNTQKPYTPSAVPKGTWRRWKPDTIKVKTRAHGRSFSKPQPPTIEGSPRRTKNAATPSPIRERMGAAKGGPLSGRETPDQLIAPANPPRITNATSPIDAVRHPITMFRIPRILM